MKSSPILSWHSKTDYPFVSKAVVRTSVTANMQCFKITHSLLVTRFPTVKTFPGPHPMTQQNVTYHHALCLFIRNENFSKTQVSSLLAGAPSARFLSFPQIKR